MPWLVEFARNRSFSGLLGSNVYKLEVEILEQLRK
jgi:hypothetical protein